MAFNVRRKANINVGRVVTKIVGTLIALWAGGTVMTILGTVMNGTTSPFYQGLTLIGWTVNASGTITSTTGTGILAVVGLIAIASIVMEFIEVKM